MNITVLTVPHCKRCDLTKDKLDRERLPYIALDAAERPDLTAQAKDLGHREAPVVLVHDDTGNLTDHWSGFRPGRIEELHDEATLNGGAWPPLGQIIEPKTRIDLGTGSGHRINPLDFQAPEASSVGVTR